jgi:hypothetical protein
MKIDIGKLAKGIRGFELVGDSWDSGGPTSGTYYGVFIDPKHAPKIEREFYRLIERLEEVTAPKGRVS